jgi:hypothetical protein
MTWSPLDWLPADNALVEKHHMDATVLPATVLYDLFRSSLLLCGEYRSSKDGEGRTLARGRLRLC